MNFEIYHMRLCKWFCLVVQALLLSALLLACDPFNTQLSEEDVTYYTADGAMAAPDKDTLEVMTWNLKFGGGRIDFFFDCFGDRVVMTPDEVHEHLEGMAAFIRAAQPDILLVQEIDVDSKRSAFIDQVQWVLDHTEFQYALYTPQWKASYIPSDGLGRMNSGLAIFSRWPLSEGRRIALPLIGEQSRLVQYFYLKRCLQACVVDIHGQKITLLNTHTAAYAQDGTKKKQLDIIIEYLQSMDSRGEDFIFAGDLNALPPGTTQTKGFPDSKCPPGEFEADDYSAETDWLSPFYEHFASAVPLPNYQLDNTPYFTHTVDGNGTWNRKLDYLFTNGTFVDASHVTYQSLEVGGFDTFGLSDHCPLSVKYLLK
jgi:endonuclease/exonuclease/phosphatase family metal-dependent hydrolase